MPPCDSGTPESTGGARPLLPTTAAGSAPAALPVPHATRPRFAVPTSLSRASPRDRLSCFVGTKRTA